MGLLMKFFAVTDEEEIVPFEAASILEALDSEPPNTHWVFSKEGLELFIDKAQEALNEA